MTAPMSDSMQQASGALIAQEAIESVRQGRRDPEIVWLRYCELCATHGKYAPAVRAFILETSKPRPAQ